MAFKTQVNKKESEISYKVIDRYGSFGPVDNRGMQMEVRTVSWNNRPAKWDIRSWGKDDDGNEIMGKGVTLTDDQISDLTELLIDIRDAE